MHAPRTAARRELAAGLGSSVIGSRSATRIVVSTFGAVVAFAGLEHGVGEILQGPIAPHAVAIESWPNAKGFEVLAGEPAMTIVPNLLVTGVLAVVVAVAVAIWAVAFVERRHGGPVLIGLSALLLLVGGGIAPPLIGIVLGVAATRINSESRRAPGRVARALAPVWPVALALGVLGYLGLVPGVVVLSWLFGVDDSNLVVALTVLAFGGLLLAPVAARAHDRLEGVEQRRLSSKGWRNSGVL